MTASRTDGTEAWTSWLSSFPLCCAPLASHRDNTTKRQGRSKSLSTTNCAMSRPKAMMSDEELLISKDDEKKPQPVVYDQPFYQPHPVAGPGTEKYQQSFGEKTSRRNAGSVRKPSRKRFWSSSSFSSRRPEISAPSNFRHISSASPSFTPREPRTPPPKVRPTRNPRPGSFRPLELSIYMVENSPSPILSHFPAPNVTPPAPVYTPDQVDEDRPLVHQKSVSSSSMSFHVPRRQPWDSSPSSGDQTQDEELPPLIPPKSRSRNRGYTSSDVESIKERVASAMAEVDKLQKQIDDVIERQSIYASSRPSTSHSVAQQTMPSELLTHAAFKGAVQTSPDMEPMPSIPALPPAAPSFAQRLNSDVGRPRTAPIRAPHPGPPRRIRTPEEVSAAFRAPPRIRNDDRPLPPPLPLVLRPPLRKKKSFSHVSNWLFPGSEHNRDLSVDSVTNLPRPIKGNEGFYQCVSPDEAPGRRRSVDSIDTFSTWESDDERTAPTAYSPGSTPATKQEDSFLSRTLASGKIDSHPRRMSVGVAY